MKAFDFSVKGTEHKKKVKYSMTLLKIGAEVYIERKRRKISKKKLATMCGLTEKEINDIEWADLKDSFPFLKIYKVLCRLGIDSNITFI